MAQLRLLDKGRLVDAKDARDVSESLLIAGDDAAPALKKQYEELTNPQDNDNYPSSRPETSVNSRSLREYRSEVVAGFLRRCTSAKTCPVC